LRGNAVVSLRAGEFCLRLTPLSGSQTVFEVAAEHRGMRYGLGLAGERLYDSLVTALQDGWPNELFVHAFSADPELRSERSYELWLTHEPDGSDSVRLDFGRPPQALASAAFTDEHRLDWLGRLRELPIGNRVVEPRRIASWELRFRGAHVVLVADNITWMLGEAPGLGSLVPLLEEPMLPKPRPSAPLVDGTRVAYVTFLAPLASGSSIGATFAAGILSLLIHPVSELVADHPPLKLELDGAARGRLADQLRAAGL
jgi:hypothetical protein